MLQPRQDVYDTYWYFAAERQSIFYRRLRNEPPPYTEDPILQQYKFCNVYRASDRVSQYLIRNVIYSGAEYSARDTLFRIFLFRLLNRNETWSALESRLGVVTVESFSFDRYDQEFIALRQGNPIYGNAFILCANKAFGYDEKHKNHLALIERVFLKTEYYKQLLDAPSLRALFELLCELPLIGPFMAYQLAIDFNYSEVINFSENDFTAAGPGAIRGIRKCFRDTNGKSDAYVIQYMVEQQEKEFTRLGLEFKKIGNRAPHAIDCQGLFCEVDKYSRVRSPELLSNRTHIKAEYRPDPRPIEYMYPPKWGVSLV